MRILVTGGAGYVGSHICDTLLAAGHEVGSLDSLVSGVDNTPEGCAYAIRADLTAIEDFGNPELIVHCAAYADVSANWAEGPRGVLERSRLMTSNVASVYALLEGAKRVPIIFLSTCAVYGDTERRARESDACEATSPYAASKLSGEALIQAYCFENQTPWHVLRLGCVVGSRYHHGHVADFVRMGQEARGDGGVIQPRNNGATRKSFIHVADVARAVELLANRESPVKSGVYNCVSDVWSPRDTIRTMGAESYTEWPENTHGWTGDPMAVASNQRLREAGWTPQHTIENGVREALASLGW